ncbi:hypothetical protein TSUD_129000 [Trifolium subterraneum]|uniref:Uncharacterized protein n=1 Tax=Trifolium subterraneum TaxID=3900 RepID=A0A2Z6N929_TRISU|nr:hypothetical protein TSUD_129000 [Trifolium subterraneum]
MAEMAVSLVLDQLIPLLKEEAKLLGRIHKEFKDIQKELQSIQAFLKDADKKAEGDNTDEGVKIWVREVREAAFRIEDVIDDYLMQVRQQPRDPGCVALLRKIVHSLKVIIPRHQIASEIQDIKSSVRGIKERSERYEFQASTEQGSRSFSGSKKATWHDPRRDAEYIDEAEMVGFEEPKNELIGWLLEGRSERTVIVVVGMGGQGKTTLARKVFDNKKVVGDFDCRVWITVSESYNIEGLLRGMLKELYKQKGDSPPQDINQMNRGSLISALRNYLQQKRYVFVFDDVWDKHFWNEIGNACIDNKLGSKIFITTRKKEVATNCHKSSLVKVHDLQPLSEDQSFELFKKKTFRSESDGCCTNALKEISLEIAKKCKGLPLAIVAIGEDYIVKSKRLIRQWIAEGFVKEESGNTLEEVAEGYLTELIHRSLVQVSSVRIDGKTKKHRRLKVLEFEVSQVKLSNILHENLGSLIHLKYLSFKNYHTVGSGFELPKSIGMLQNLETLDLGSYRIYEIPKEVSNLRKLRHLLGFRMSLFQLKGGIGGMETLQTLSSVQIGDSDDGIELIKELGKLRQLRKLSLFHVMEDYICTLSSSLNEMQYLENLYISSNKSGNCYLFIDLHLDSPPPMLRSLTLRGALVKLPEWILKLQNLVKLKLQYSHLSDDPIKLLENMQNLFSLSIINRAYDGESLHFHDGGFQNLKELYIRDLANLNTIVVDEGALRSLKKFELSHIPNLKTVPAGIQHLGKLEVLNLPPDHSCEGSNCGPPFQVQHQSPLDQLMIVRATVEGDNIRESIKIWVKQVIEVAFRIEDIIDDYMIYVEQQPRDPKCLALLCKIAHSIKTLISRHRVASEIQDIKSSVKEIKERCERYGFQIQPTFEQAPSTSQKAKWHDPRMIALHMEEADVVGFQMPKERLIDLLVNGRVERTVVSVVGMGGQGKTTLAKNVFDSKEVISHFHFRAWITVSQTYTIEGLLRDMLRKFYNSLTCDITNMDRGSLIDEVKNYLKKKRLCLLYFGIYPEDYEIESNRLFGQWIAEGFVKKERGKTLEDVAEGYLTELIRRSLVQVSSISIDGKVECCHVHDLIRVVILDKFDDFNFCHHISEYGQSFLSGTIRRLSIASVSDNLMEHIESLHVRSLLCFTNKELPEHFVRRIPTKYKQLKVIDFKDVELPENLGGLIHLKFLSLRNNRHIKNLPKSISMFQNLETFDLRETGVREMPKEIGKLRKLRHLLGDRMSLIQLKNCIGCITSLQTLHNVSLDGDGVGVAELITELGKLKELRELGLVGIVREHGSYLSSSINEMKCLEKLDIESKSKEKVIDLHLISSPPPMLRNLTLSGKLEKFPEWIPELQNLVELRLVHSQLTDDPMKSLKNMKNLLSLFISDCAYEGESLHFQDGEFHKLKELCIANWDHLSSIVIEKGALRSLKMLTLYYIPQLKTAPIGIQYLEKLEVLRNWYMPTEFVESVSSDGGKEHWIIEHVPLVEFHHEANGRYNHNVFGNPDAKLEEHLTASL